MLKPVYHKRFEKEVKKAKKRGNNMENLKTVIMCLLNENHLPEKNRNHKLRGEFGGCWECHIEPDWLSHLQKNIHRNYSC